MNLIILINYVQIFVSCKKYFDYALFVKTDKLLNDKLSSLVVNSEYIDIVVQKTKSKSTLIKL